MGFIAILSDIHGNLNAYLQTMDSLSQMKIKAVILLGDLIDYGMHSNEVITLISNIPYPVLCNIRGNHEQAVLTEDYSQFSSERGRQCAQYTKSILSQDTLHYIKKDMHSSGKYEFMLNGRKCLAVHGSLEDIYWKSIKPDQELKIYSKYDYVFSGHSHMPHFFEVFYPADIPEQRNRKKTVFINPGAVGQPRNLNPMAQFALLDVDSGEIVIKRVPYDIKMEQKAYRGQVDPFYCERLERGI